MGRCARVDQIQNGEVFTWRTPNNTEELLRVTICVRATAQPDGRRGPRHGLAMILAWDPRNGGGYTRESFGGWITNTVLKTTETVYVLDQDEIIGLDLTESQLNFLRSDSFGPRPESVTIPLATIPMTTPVVLASA